MTIYVSDEKIRPDGYYLFDTYPNPFNSNTVIGYQLPVNANVKIKIYDVLGKEVANLSNEAKTAGKYEIEFDASKYNLSSGVYIIRMEANDNKGYIFTASKKLLLLK